MLSVLTRKSLNNTNIKFSSITDHFIYYALHEYTTYIYRHLLQPLQTIVFINLQRNQVFHVY